MGLRLVELTPAYRHQLNDMMEEWLALEQDFSPYAIRRYDYRDFDFYLEHLECRQDTEDRVTDWVRFLLDEERNRFLGAVNIRHHLNQSICHTGGHIGDGVRPSERGKGYATAMIGMALDLCRELGMNKVLMTCDTANRASAQSIIRNGGVLEREILEDGVPEQRYWITLKEEIIESPRLILKREMPPDYAEAAAWTTDPEVYRYLLSAPCEKPEDFIPMLERADPNSAVAYYMIARSKADGHAVGTIGLFEKEPGTWEFAYSLRRDDWGKGYATEATGAMMNYLTGLHGPLRFQGECAADNQASARVMEKLGLSYVSDSSYTKKDGSVTFASRVYVKEPEQKAK